MHQDQRDPYQVADGGSLHVVGQSREDEHQRRRVGGAVVIRGLCELLQVQGKIGG